MWMSCRHYDGLSFRQLEFLTINGYFSNSIQTGYKGISAGNVCADFLALCKEENKVTLTASFCASVLLTICPS